MSEIYHFFSKLDFLEKQVIFLSLPVIAEEFYSNLKYYVWDLQFFSNLDYLENQTSHSKQELYLNGHED